MGFFGAPFFLTCSLLHLWPCLCPLESTKPRYLKELVHSISKLSLQLAINLSALILIPFFLFGGFFVAPGTAPPYLDWIRFISPFYYAYPIIFVNEMTGLTFGCQPSQYIQIPPSLGCNTTAVCPFTTGEQYLAYQNLSTVDIVFNLGMLGVLTLGFRILSYLIFFLSTRSKNVQ